MATATTTVTALARPAGSSTTVTTVITANPSTSVTTIRIAGVWVPATVYERVSGTWRVAS